ncbi:MAG: hypothetical protein JXL84_09000 [Deltaproteobacteria bacterium]|nr:hypothetical protein [Deltaproteobacteria bacterium]
MIGWSLFGGPFASLRGFVVLTSLMGIVFLSLPSCSGTDDVTAIRNVVKEGARLGEKHELGEIFELTTEDFTALPGKLDRRETRRILWLAFRHYGEFRILYPRPGVEVQSDRRSASAVFPFLIVRKDASFPNLKDLVEDPQRWLDAVGENADLYRLKLDLIKEGAGWRVRQAHIQRFTGVSFGE